MLLVANDMALGTFASSLRGPDTGLAFDYVARSAGIPFVTPRTKDSAAALIGKVALRDQ